MPVPTHADIDRASAFLATVTQFPSFVAGAYALPEGPCAGLAIQLPCFDADCFELRQAHVRILIEDALRSS